VKGTVTSKCRRGHRRAEGRCGSRCLRWYYVLDLGPGPDGRRRRRWSAGFDRKGDAETALRAELDRLDQNIGVDASKVTVAASPTAGWPMCGPPATRAPQPSTPAT
jgi:Arm DNA-binding domain